jgi:hypothetical protein
MLLKGTQQNVVRAEIRLSSITICFQARRPVGITVAQHSSSMLLGVVVSKDRVPTETGLQSALGTLPGREVRDRWPTTLELANTPTSQWISQ